MTHPSIRTVDGDKRSQELARQTFPILVRQARAGQPLTYGELARELDSHPRPMRFPLGIIGRAIEDLGEEWDEYIPPIQAYVVSQRDGVPSEGIASYTKRPTEYKDSDLEGKRAIAAKLQYEAHEFGRWDEVLDYYGLPMPDSTLSSIQDSNGAGSWSGHGTEESDAHRRLKERIAEDPTLVDLLKSHGPGTTEYEFPTGDQVDVLFHRLESEWIAVEVKLSQSGDDELRRGLLQCVKYEALLGALATGSQYNVDVEAVLAVDGQFPSHLLGWAHTLGVDIKEATRPQDPQQ